MYAACDILYPWNKQHNENPRCRSHLLKDEFYRLPSENDSRFHTNLNGERYVPEKLSFAMRSDFFKHVKCTVIEVSAPILMLNLDVIYCYDWCSEYLCLRNKIRLLLTILSDGLWWNAVSQEEHTLLKFRTRSA
jgi:hypothetical protein